MSFTKGPIKRLPEGIVRYEIVYRVEERDGWNVKRMWKTDAVGAEERIGKNLYERLKTKPNRFEIVTIRNIGNEVPLATGQPTAVVTPSEYESLRAAEAMKFSSAEVEERAKELGLWYPGLGKKFNA